MPTAATADLIPSTDIKRIVSVRDALILKAQELAAIWSDMQELATQIAAPRVGEECAHGLAIPSLQLKGYDIDERFSVSGFRETIDTTCWRFLMEQSGMLTVMSADAKAKWQAQARRAPSGHAKDALPMLTLENVAQTFAVLFDKRLDFLIDGVVRVFEQLASNYKTNNRKRFTFKLILSGLVDRHGFFNHRTCDRIDDLLRICYLADGKPQPDAREGMYRQLSRSSGGVRQFDQKLGWITTEAQRAWEDSYISLRWFKKGTGHLKFKRGDIVIRLNQIMAKRYPNAICTDVRPNHGSR